MDIIAADTRFSFLTLDGKISSGGLGIVYRMQAGTRGSFALKLPFKVNPITYGHFAREAELLCALNKRQAAVPELIYGGVNHDVPYILMNDLGANELTSSTGDPVEKATRVALDVLDVLAKVHALGYSHDDLKPSNIHYSNTGKTHLLDFASATPLQGMDNPRCVTLRYAAPERFTDKHSVSPATDIFSLGATIYELIAGAPAFRGSDMYSTHAIQAHITSIHKRDYAPLHNCPDHLTALIDSMLHYDPSQRPRLPEIRAELLMV